MKSSTAWLSSIAELYFQPNVYTLSIQCWIFVLEFFDVRFRIQHCWIPVVHPLSIQCWIFVLNFFDVRFRIFNKNTFIYCDLLYGQDMTFLYFYRNWLFSESSLLTLKSSAKKFSTNTKIFSSAGFHVHHHLMLNIYTQWDLCGDFY